MKTASQAMPGLKSKADAFFEKNYDLKASLNIGLKSWCINFICDYDDNHIGQSIPVRTRI